jgi:hypothetical protein
MPATKLLRKRTSAATNQSLPKRPTTPYPGYLTDEWFQYAMAMMERETPAKIRRDLVEFGILDKKGNYTASYRND